MRQHLIVVFFFFLILACSIDRPAPVAPAGKAADFGDMFDLLGRLEQETQETEEAKEVVELESFDIELIFIDSFSTEEKEWMRDVAGQWERLFYDAPDYTFNLGRSLNLPGANRGVFIRAGEQIDDLRIYVGKVPQGITSGWDQAPGGFASVSVFRPDGNVPLVASIFMGMENIERNMTETWSRYSPSERGKIRENFLFRKNFHHEMGHAFGVGQSPVWNHYVVQSGRSYFYTGPNALREYELLCSDIDPRGIELVTQSLNEKIPAHWAGRYAVQGPIGWTLFDWYFRFADGNANITRIDLGVFDDIGWEVNYEDGPQVLLTDEFLGECWVNNEQFSWFDVRIDCEE